MKLSFLNRNREINRINKAITTQGSAFIVVYGRRRCGKSTLLQHILREQDIYYLADQQESPLQIKSLAAEISRQIPGFDARRIYPYLTGKILPDSFLTAPLQNRSSRIWFRAALIDVDRVAEEGER